MAIGRSLRLCVEKKRKKRQQQTIIHQTRTVVHLSVGGGIIKTGLLCISDQLAGLIMAELTVVSSINEDIKFVIYCLS